MLVFWSQMLLPYTPVFCYYQNGHKKLDRRSLRRRGYQVLLNVWSISWSKGSSIPLLTSVIQMVFLVPTTINLNIKVPHDLALFDFKNRSQNIGLVLNPSKFHRSTPLSLPYLFLLPVDADMWKATRTTANNHLIHYMFQRILYTHSPQENGLIWA